MNHDLIVFAEDWGALPSSSQHLVKHLAQTRNVLWVNSIGLRQPKFSSRDIKRVWQKITRHQQANSNVNTMRHNSPQYTGLLDDSLNGQSEKNYQFHIVNPKTIPAPRSSFSRYLAVQLLLRQIKPLLKKLNFNKPILWLSLPTAVDMVGQLDESAVVYYCCDDFSGLAGVDHNTVAKRENELVTKANLVIASSQQLCLSLASINNNKNDNKESNNQKSNAPADTEPKNKKPTNGALKLLTHGVDYQLFSTAQPRAKDLPTDGRPIAGFYGSISQWLDIPLLTETIEQLPHWYFVFIGNVTVDISQLTQFDNVLLLGERPHSDLPSYSQHWTVSLLPFIDNVQIRACNPLKLSEYLAAGSPIICTHFPAVQRLLETGLLQVASSSEAMVEALRCSESLKHVRQLSPALQNKVAQDSWQSRAQQASNWIATL
jgi:glycosyltransferase involved in cell wall biosynthesis